jgi:MFS family permease
MSPRDNKKTVETAVASRLDRLPFSRWHWLIVAGLGVTWILDGPEVTPVGALSGILQKPEGLGLTAAQIGATATFYLSGNVVGALLSGYLTDRLGRKKLSFVIPRDLGAVQAVAADFSGYAGKFRCFLERRV